MSADGVVVAEDVMSLHPKVQLSKLRAIGWNMWDPIGMRDLVSEDLRSGPVDEYDGYLLKVVSLLSHGHPLTDAANYLEQIASDHMGLGHSPEHIPAAETTVSAIAEYLLSLPDAPEALKP